MLLLNPTRAAIRTPVTYRGKEIVLMIKPYDAEYADELKQKHTTYEVHVHPQTQQLQRVPILDDNAWYDDLLDDLLDGFEGVGEAAEKPLPVTKKNKTRLIAIPPSPGETALGTFILEKAKEYAVIIEKEVEKEDKEREKK